jgi:hypothetical protein
MFSFKQFTHKLSHTPLSPTLFSCLSTRFFHLSLPHSSSSFSFPLPPLLPSLSRFNDFCSSVGNTSLIKLRGPSESTGCEIWAKCEWENPAGSVKDRAALFIVKEAEEKGILVPGGKTKKKKRL